MSTQDETAPVVDEAPVTESAAPSEAEAPAGPPEGYIEQDRYDNLRREFNQRQALWNRAEQGDLDAMRELKLPLQFGDDTEPEEEDDQGFRDPRLDTLLQEREQERVAREQQEAWDRFRTDLDKVAKGTKLSDDDRLVIYTKTLQRGGNPDALEQAYGDFAKARKAYDDAVIAAHVQAKKNAPFIPSGGTGANEVTDPLDGHARRERLAARMAALDTD